LTRPSPPGFLPLSFHRGNLSLPELRRVLITKAEIQRYLKVGETAVDE
jgi:hypothetical protein